MVFYDYWVDLKWLEVIGVMLDICKCIGFSFNVVVVYIECVIVGFYVVYIGYV